MTSAVLQTIRLGNPPWPTVDPFLFCVHHLDHYPEADGAFGPAASLQGRDIGQDFAGKDGWRMYHGATVPGFPQHPHRGFETVTYARQGLIDHSDSLGAAARFGRGDVQWMTAGKGIVHSEMFPLFNETGPNPAELFQIWMNLPSSRKMVDPYFTMLWDGEIPRHRPEGEEGDGAEITVIAGALAGLEPPSAPPDSWASSAESDVAIWHLRFDADGRWTMPAAAGGTDTVRTLYVFDGGSLAIDGEVVAAGNAAVVDAAATVELTAPDGAVEVLVLQGRPIAEPVAQYGPFVMNTQTEIEQAFADYRRTEFGGWPWPSDAPVHGPDQARFARHADGHTDTPPGVLVSETPQN